jgi:N-acetylmuramic acid 6-phosphate etherase
MAISAARSNAMQPDELLLGIDGGATKTAAWLATRSEASEPQVVGRGTAGPANPQTVGLDQVLVSLDEAVAAAFHDAAVPPGPVAAAVLALAGSDRDENRRALENWALARRLARSFRVVHDALPVLVAGSPEGWGIALISGTGSFAFGQSPDGRSARAGGWGFLFGDEGSGYAIALAGLRAAARSADGRGPKTQLLEALLDRLGLRQAQELISAVYRIASDRAAIASLAGVVTDSAEAGDTVARHILDDAASELAAMVAAVARKLGFTDRAFPLAVTGGVLLNSQEIRGRLEVCLTTCRRRPACVERVYHPVVGALRLAERLRCPT